MNLNVGAGRAGKREEGRQKRQEGRLLVFWTVTRCYCAVRARAYANGRTTERANVYRPLFQART